MTGARDEMAESHAAIRRFRAGNDTQPGRHDAHEVWVVLRQCLVLVDCVDFSLNTGVVVAGRAVQDLDCPENARHGFFGQPDRAECAVSDRF